MRHKLRDDLSFCRIDNHLIFLDIQNDRYFCLPEVTERALLSYIDQDEWNEPGMAQLLSLNILTESISTGDHNVTSASTIHLPIKSAIEQAPAIRNSGLFTLMEVFTIVYTTHRQLKKRKLKDIIDSLLSYRQKRTKSPLSHATESDDQRLLEISAIFRQARLYVPIDTCCLLDSISMIKFLARRNLSAKIVFGVTRDPFAAHCWVQSGDWVLNDTVGNAITHTPIRSV